MKKQSVLRIDIIIAQVFEESPVPLQFIAVQALIGFQGRIPAIDQPAIVHLPRVQPFLKKSIVIAAQKYAVKLPVELYQFFDDPIRFAPAIHILSEKTETVRRSYIGTLQNLAQCPISPMDIADGKSALLHKMSFYKLTKNLFDKPGFSNCHKWNETEVIHKIYGAINFNDE